MSFDPSSVKFDTNLGPVAAPAPQAPASPLDEAANLNLGSVDRSHPYEPGSANPDSAAPEIQSTDDLRALPDQPKPGDWVPSYTRNQDGSITLGNFDFDKYKEILQKPGQLSLPKEQDLFKNGTTEDLARQIDYDRGMWSRYEGGQDLTKLDSSKPEDVDYFRWASTRGLLETKDVPFWDQVWGLTKSLVKGTVVVAKDLGSQAAAGTPGTESSAQVGARPVDADANARLGAEVKDSAAQIQANYQLLASGLREKLVSAANAPIDATGMPTDDPTVRAQAAPRIAQAQLDHYKRVAEVSQKVADSHDAMLQVAMAHGANAEDFDAATNALQFGLDPANLALPVLGKIGAALFDVAGKPMLGLTEAARLQVAQHSAALRDIQSEIARFGTMHGEEAASRVESLLQDEHQVGYELQNAKFQLENSTNSVNQWLKQFGPGLLNRVVGGAAEAVGGAVEQVGQRLSGLNKAAVDAATNVGKGEASATDLLKRTAEKYAPTALAGYAVGYAAGGDNSSGLAGFGIGAALPGTLSGAGRLVRVLGETYSLGQSTIPFLQRFAQNAEVTGLESWIARKIDPFEGFQPGSNLISNALALAKRSIYAEAAGAGRFAKGAAVGAVPGAALGWVAGGDQGGAAGGAAAAVAGHFAPWAIIGGFYNAFRPAISSEDLISQRVGSLNFLKQRLAGDSAQLDRLNSLTPEHQLDVAHYAMSNPDFTLLLADKDQPRINVDLGLKGSPVPDLNKTPGFRYTDPATNRSVIVLNRFDANPGNWLGDIFNHELWHAAQANGLKDPIVRATIGDKDLGVPGMYTQLGADGAPVRKADGSFELHPDFTNAKATYEQRVRDISGIQDYKISDSDFALEYAADAGADFLKDQGTEISRPSLGGMVKEMLGSQPFVRNVLAKLGVPFTTEGDVKGTLNIPGLRHSPEVTSLMRDYARRRANGDLEYNGPENASVKIGRDTILNNPSLLQTVFGGSSEINFDTKTGLPAGVAMKDGKMVVTDESKLFKSARQINQEQAAMTELISKAAEQAADAKNDPQAVKPLVVDGKTIFAGRYLSEQTVQAIEAAGKLNPIQLDNLKNLNALMRAGTGDYVRMFYQPASKMGRRYQSLSGHWREEVPYSWHITKADNVTFRTVSYDKVVRNLENLWTKDSDRATSLWASQTSMVADAKTYLENLSKGLPGDTGISTGKRDFINLALGINTTDRPDVNPLYGPSAKRLESFVTSRRIDRTNHLMPGERSQQLPWSYEAYKRGRLNLTPGDYKDVTGSESSTPGEPGDKMGVKPTDTPAFRRWFGDSKVVDADGKPLVVYHGTDSKFTSFKVSSGGLFGPGIYFTDDRADATTSGRKVMKVYVSTQHPIDITGENKLPADVLAVLPKRLQELAETSDATDILLSVTPPMLEKIKALGYDGVVDRGSAKTGKPTWINVFSPEQIKSATGNTGAFDPKNPDIRLTPGAAGDTGAGDGNSRADEETVRDQGVRVLDSRGGASFGAAIRAGIEGHPNASAVDVKSDEEYSREGYQHFLSPNGTAGASVTPEGDLVSVFKKYGSADKVDPVLQAASAKAKTLDAYAGGDGFLQNRYAKVGFRPVARLPFNDEYAPPGWNFEKQGRPDVVFMVKDGKPMGGSWNEVKDSVPVVQDYDEAKKLQADALAGKDVQLTPGNVSTVPIMKDEEKLDLGEKPDVSTIAGALAARSRKAARIPFDSRTPEAKDRIASVLADEIGHAVNQDRSAIGWYDRKVREAMDTIAEVHPELKEDPGLGAVFKAITAITSNGQAVEENFARAEQVYQDWKDTGRLDTKSNWGGQRSNQINAGLEKLQGLIEDLGVEGTKDFLGEKMTVSELKKLGHEVNGELADTLVPGSIIFGPKVGGGFYPNLQGDFSPVTMDLWLMRTWNRINGSYGQPDRVNMGKALGDLREEAEKLASSGDPKAIELTKMSDRQLANWAEKNYADWKGVRKFKDAGPLDRPSKRFSEAREGAAEAPRNGSERAWVREVFQKVDEILKDRGLPEITNADKQALLWYYEKDLYTKLGYRSTKGQPADYATAARKVVEAIKARQGAPQPVGL